MLYDAKQGSKAPGIYQSRRRDRESSWDPPVNLGPALSASEAKSPCLSPDGLTLLFHSYRSGVGHDIWRVRRKALDAPFEALENLGSGVNTELIELTARFTPDQRAILFSRGDDKGPAKLYLAFEDASGQWTAQLLDLPGIGKGEYWGAWSPVLSPDGRTLYFSSFTPPGGRGGYDLWQIRRVPKTK